MLLSEGHARRGLTLARIAALTAGNPARTMGLAHVKGAIAPALDADLAFIDPNGEWTLAQADVVSSAGYSIYEGWRFRGRVVHTMVRGRLVLRDGVAQAGATGWGRYVPRRLSH